MPHSQENKLAGSLTSLQTSDNVKYVQQVTEFKSEPSSYLIIAERLGTKDKRKRVNSFYFSFHPEQENTVYPTFFVLKGNDGVGAGEFNFF